MGTIVHNEHRINILLMLSVYQIRFQNLLYNTAHVLGKQSGTLDKVPGCFEGYAITYMYNKMTSQKLFAFAACHLVLCILDSSLDV